MPASPDDRDDAWARASTYWICPFNPEERDREGWLLGYGPLPGAETRDRCWATYRYVPNRPGQALHSVLETTRPDLRALAGWLTGEMGAPQACRFLERLGNPEDLYRLAE